MHVRVSSKEGGTVEWVVPTAHLPRQRSLQLASCSSGWLAVSGSHGGAPGGVAMAKVQAAVWYQG